jgi:hypothetical protein
MTTALLALRKSASAAFVAFHFRSLRLGSPAGVGFAGIVGPGVVVGGGIA